jgi:hypothetical protein
VFAESTIWGMTMATNEVLLGSKDAARILCVTPTRVRQLAEEGILPCERTSTGIRVFHESDVRELRARREVRAGPRDA